jgi:hypothetical protein
VRFSLRLATLLTGLVASSVHAAPHEAALRCIQTMPGIVWRMPYAPSVRLHTCGSPEVTWGRDTPSDGSTVLELIGDAVLWFDDRPGVSRAQRVAASQQAVQLHFRRLFEHHGFVLVEALPDASNPGRFVEARFERRELGQAQFLRFEAVGDNLWRVTFQP